MYQDSRRYGNVHPYDYANWGYIILYLVVILFSLFGNSMFLMTIKKNQHFRRTHHIFLAFLSMRDLIVTILVVPFVIDSQAVNLLKWKSGEITCKLYIFLHWGTMSTHAFMLVFLLLFLYFWYRKQEAYMNADGSTVVRQTRMHKWAIPLAWIIGFGLAAVAGALARVTMNQNTGIQSCAVWDGRGSGSGGYSVAVSNVFVSFIGPTLIILFPFIALLMQVCGGRQPKLDPPHNRNAMIALALAFVFVVSRAPYEIYELMKLFHKSGYGFKANSTWGTPYAHWTFETDIVLNCMIFVVAAIHPIIYFVFSAEYRTGLSNVWKGLACNQSPAERARQLEAKRQGRQYSNGGQTGPIVKTRTPMHMRPGDQPLLNSHGQPQIMAAAPGQPHYYPYPQIAGHIQPQVPQPGTTYLFPEHSLQPGQTSFNNSFERANMSPALPAEFEYNGLRYIDMARVEPKIGYSPQKTPPKTPETPHFSHTPFINPNTTTANPDPVWPQPGQVIEMKDMPVATSERKSTFELENMDSSPGNTLRERNRRITSPPTSPNPLDNEERVEMLQESPGASRNRRNRQSENQPHQEKKTNGNLTAFGSRSISPSSGHDNVEIVITGRTRSRQDLCPEVPQSKFEHAV